jgi:hypothetical protein
MKTFKKKDFKRIVIESSKVDEFVNDDGGIISGDETFNKGTEIKTGPINHQGDIKGIPQTTDDFAAQAIQPRNWWWSMSYGYGQGQSRTPSTAGNLGEGDDITESNVNKMVEDILKRRTNNKDMVTKSNASDINRNDIPDIDDLSDNQMIVVGKMRDFIDTINSNNLSGEEIGIVLNYLVMNIETSQIPSDYKNIIRKSL